MNYFLKLSLIIITLVFITSEISLAQKPKISISSSVDAVLGGANQESGFRDDRLLDAVINDSSNLGTKNQQNHDIDGSIDSKFQLKIEKNINFDVKFGGIVEFQADIATNRQNQDFDIDKGYIFAKSNYGKLEIGNNVGASQTMKVGPSVFARAAGGVNGRYLEFINLPILADSSQNISQAGNCNGFRVNVAGLITTSGSDCNNIKLPRFILTPQLPISHGGYAQSFYAKSTDNSYNNQIAKKNLGFNKIDNGSFGDLEDATKISYYSPKISGLQIGASLTPDTGNSSSEYFNHNQDGDIKNAVSLGVSYSRNIGNLGLGLSFTSEFGKFKENNINNVKRNDLKAYEIGAMANYLGFTFGGSYGSWGDSLMPKTGIYSCKYDSSISLANQDCQNGNGGSDYNNLTKNDEAKYYSLGLAYKISSFGLSLTHLESEFQNNKYQATSLGFDYKFRKGLMPYFEITRFEFNSEQISASDVSNANQIQDNEGYVGLVGLLFSF